MNRFVSCLFICNLQRSSMFCYKSIYLLESNFKKSFGSIFSSSNLQSNVFIKKSEFIHVLSTSIALDMYENNIYYQNQIWNTDLSLVVNSCKFHHCHGQYSGGFCCKSKSSNINISDTIFILCVADAATTNGYRTSVSCGAFIADCLSMYMQKSCFFGCYGIGDAFVYHSSASQNNQLNKSCLIDNGKLESRHFGCIIDYGYQYFVENNGTSNRCSGHGSFAATCCLSKLFHVSYNNIVNNSDTLNSFGFGGINEVAIPYIGYLNVINNRPKNSVFCSWTKAFQINFSIFLGSISTINTAYSGSLSLYYCYSDTSFNSVQTIQCYPNNNSATTVPVFGFNCALSLDNTVNYRSYFLIPTLINIVIY